MIWRRGVKAWVSHVKDVIADLEALNHSTEADFLTVGSRLSGFSETADGIRRTICESDAVSADGTSDNQAADALSAVLQRCESMRLRVSDSAGQLERLRQSADRIRHGFSGLSGMALSFQVAATLGRIETARLGSAGTDLSHLAENVRASAEAISSQAIRAGEIAASLEQRIAGETSRISELRSQELKALPALTGMADESLAEFRARRRQERVSSEQLETRFALFSGAVGRVVTALQFHDITRQQVEHVVNALRTATSRNRSRESDLQALAIVDLQRLQLWGASESFAGSAGEVLDGLREIAASGREIAEEANALLGLTAGDKDSFNDRMKHNLARVVQAVARCVSLQTKTASAVSELQQAIGLLERCVDEIQAIGWGIHHLAINTTIEAVHLGGSGEPLSMVASAMQDLQADAQGCAEDAADALAAMAGAVNAMAEAAGAGGDSDSLLRDLESGIEQLHESSERRAAWAYDIRSAAAKLREDVDRASAEFRVGERFEEVARRCCASLQLVTNENASPAATVSTASALAERYTMDAERTIHREAFGGSDVEPRLPVAATAGPGGYGDNVELF